MWAQMRRHVPSAMSRRPIPTPGRPPKEPVSAASLPSRSRLETSNVLHRQAPLALPDGGWVRPVRISRSTHGATPPATRRPSRGNANLASRPASMGSATPSVHLSTSPRNLGRLCTERRGPSNSAAPSARSRGPTASARRPDKQERLERRGFPPEHRGRRKRAQPAPIQRCSVVQPERCPGPAVNAGRCARAAPQL